MDFGGFDALSLSGSAFATLATVYFWLVRANRERPKLRIFLDGSGRHDRWLGEDVEFEGTPEVAPTRYRIAARLPVVMVNESVRPNVTLRAAVSVQRPDGSWMTCDTRWEEHTFPRDLTPESTTRFDVRIRSEQEFEREPDGESLPAIIGQLARPFRFRITIHSINGETSKTEVGFPVLEEQVRTLTQTSKEAATIRSPQPPSGVRMHRIDETDGIQLRIVSGPGSHGKTINPDDTFRDNVGEEYRFDARDDTRVTIVRQADNARFRIPITARD